MLYCKNCNILHSGAYSKSFCSQYCARSYSTKYDNKKETKIAHCIICGKQIYINKRHSVKTCKCDLCWRSSKRKKNNKWAIDNKTKLKKYNKNRHKKISDLPVSYASKSKLTIDLPLYEEIRESINGNIECKCTYCGIWFEPKHKELRGRLGAIEGALRGERRLYCSSVCKNNCPSYNQSLYFKDQNINTSREVQPELRQFVFKRDNYTCQKCGFHKNHLRCGLHCHHVEGILWEPVQSADLDMCITYCEVCHAEVHKIFGCEYSAFQCNRI